MLSTLLSPLQLQTRAAAHPQCVKEWKGGKLRGYWRRFLGVRCSRGGAMCVCHIKEGQWGKERWASWQ